MLKQNTCKLILQLLMLCLAFIVGCKKDSFKASGLKKAAVEETPTATPEPEEEEDESDEAETPTVSLATQADLNFPSNYLDQGATTNIDFNNAVLTPPDDTDMTYTCAYDQVVDDAVNAGTDCTSLPGTITFSASAGTLAWTPNTLTWGPFEIKVTGTNSLGSDSAVFVIDVRPAYVLTNLRGDWDAQFANLTSNYSSASNTWKDLTTNANDGASNTTSHATWVGDGSPENPYALNLNGSANVDFGAGPLLSQTKMMFSSWLKSSDVSSRNDAVIVGNSSNATGSGFTVRQHPSYRDAVMSLNPVGYWRLDERSGTVAADISGNGYHGTYVNNPLLAQAGALTGNPNTSATFNGTNQYVSIATATNFPSGNSSYAITAWIKPTGFGGYGIMGWGNYTVPNDTNALRLQHAGEGFNGLVNYWYFNDLSVPTPLLANGEWHFVIAQFDGTTRSIWADGAQVASNTPALVHNAPIANVTIGATGGTEYFSGGLSDVAVFNTALTAAQIASLYKAGTTGKKMDFVIGQSYQEVILADNPVGYWRLGETSGLGARDISGNGRNGAYVGGATLGQTGAIAGDADKAVTFDGTNDGVEFGVNDFSFERTDAFSIEAWIKYTTTAVISIFNKLDPANNHRGYQLDSINGYIYVTLINNYNGLNRIQVHTPAGSNDGMYHLINMTYDGSNTAAGIKIYIDGVSQTLTVVNDSLTGTILNTEKAHIANRTDNMFLFDGVIDEVALYASELTGAQVLAHYEAGLANYGGICRSTSSFSDNLWNYIAGIFSGTTAKFFSNGREECTVNVTNGFTSPASDLFVGATDTNTKNWMGRIADLKVYGTSDGSAVADATTVKTNFDKTAERFRESPVGNIVTSGLVLNLDAANAKRGLYPNSIGCASVELSWFDLSSSALTGTLTNFSSCSATSGWNGDGTTTVSGAAGPYRLTFDGADERVDLGSYNLNVSTAFTMEAWIRANNDADFLVIFANKTKVSGHFELYLDAGTGRLSTYTLDLSPVNVHGATDLRDSAWHHVVATYDGSNTVVYVDAIIDGTQATTGTIASGSAPIMVGDVVETNITFNGDIAVVRIYNRALSQSEISQNCNATRARFSGATCD